MAKQPKNISDLFNDLPFRHYPAKQIMLYKGDTISRIYYIISGYARMYNVTGKGHERTLTILGPGETIPLIQTPSAQYNYDALTDVEVAHGTYQEIISRFLADKSYMEVARDASVKLMTRMMKQMEALAGDTVGDRIEQMLEFLGEYYGEPRGSFNRICFRLTHQELANLVNVARETVSQNMARLERKKMIKFDGDGYLLVTPAKHRH